MLRDTQGQSYDRSTNRIGQDIEEMHGPRAGMCPTPLGQDRRMRLNIRGVRATIASWPSRMV